MKHAQMLARAGIAAVLIALSLGCTTTPPLSGVYDNSSYEFEHSYMGVFGYTAQPTYVYHGYETYSLGTPIYSNAHVSVIPEWVVTAPDKHNPNVYYANPNNSDYQNPLRQD